MEKTVGTADRILRILVAAAAVAGSAALGFSAAWGIVLLAVAAIMVVTAATGYCPLYSALGISTTGASSTRRSGFHLHRSA